MDDGLADSRSDVVCPAELAVKRVGRDAEFPDILLASGNGNEVYGTGQPVVFLNKDGRGLVTGDFVHKSTSRVEIVAVMEYVLRITEKKPPLPDGNPTYVQDVDFCLAERRGAAVKKTKKAAYLRYSTPFKLIPRNLTFAVPLSCAATR
jgi:hypothetical protein